MGTAFCSSIFTWHRPTSQGGGTLVSWASFSGKRQKPSQTPSRPEEKFSGWIQGYASWTPRTGSTVSRPQGWNQGTKTVSFSVCAFCLSTQSICVTGLCPQFSVCVSLCGSAAFSVSSSFPFSFSLSLCFSFLPVLVFTFSLLKAQLFSLSPIYSLFLCLPPKAECLFLSGT